MNSDISAGENTLTDSQGQNWTTVISSDKKKFHIGVRELFRYRDLIGLFFKRDFTAMYKQTILGPAWYLIQPIFTTLVYAFVFGNLARLGTDNVPPYLFYLSGIILWRFFSDALNKTSGTFLKNAPLFGKVYFPRLSSPISTVLSSLISLAIQFLLFTALYVFYVLKGMHIQIQWSFALFPLVVLQIGLLGAGIGLMITSMTTKYRDLKFLVTFGLQLWMYASPIAYPLSEIMTRVNSPVVQWIFRLNPVAFPVECFRFMLFQGNKLNFIDGGISIAVTVIVLLIGIVTFNRVQQDFMDRI